MRNDDPPARALCLGSVVDDPTGQPHRSGGSGGAGVRSADMLPERVALAIFDDAKSRRAPA